MKKCKITPFFYGKIGMQRLIIRSLEQWKQKQNRNPLIIQGARQVGKTWIMKYFGQHHFQQVAYINFDSIRSKT